MKGSMFESQLLTVVQLHMRTYENTFLSGQQRSTSVGDHCAKLSSLTPIREQKWVLSKSKTLPFFVLPVSPLV